MMCSNVSRNDNVVSRFELQVEQYPNHIALRDKSIEYTYLALNERTNQFAAWLRKKSIKPRDFVAVYLEPSADFIICLLAILKVGATYVPLDRFAPVSRLRNILLDTCPKLLLVEKNHSSLFKEFKITTGFKEDILLESAHYDKHNIITPILAESPCYMMFTSGTTGRPKGVVVPHRAVINLIEDNALKLGPNDTMAQFSNLAFDGSTFDIWTSLLNASTLVIIPQEARGNHQKLQTVLQENQIKHIFLPTGYLHQLANSYPETLDGVSKIMVGGEQVNPQIIKLFFEYRKQKKSPILIVNGYGPTETTGYICRQIINGSNLEGEFLASIGQPIPHVKLYILDNNLNEVSEGELCISGASLALGYYQSSITKEKFITNPFEKNAPYTHLYKTGDLVKRLPNGDFLCLGRLDDQVKMGGFRIHLSEIEHELMHHEDISLGSVVVETGGGSHQFLTAYIVFTNKENVLSAEEIRNFLALKLPYYMLPAKYVAVGELPLTPIGKVDKKNLDKIPHTNLTTHMDTSSKSHIEDKIKQIWKSLLNNQHIESNKNFFDLGANSILLTEACSCINKELDCNLEMIDLLTHPTIHKLSGFLEGNLESTLRRETKRSITQDIAIVGMSCRFPKARTIDEFWQNICEGIDCLTRFDESPLPYSSVEKENYVPVRGTIENVDMFDAHFFNFSPIDAKITDPQHRIFLECVWDALEHAAIAPNKMNAKVISVFSGMTDSTYLKENLEKSSISSHEVDHFQQRIATSMSMLSTQVSYRLNFKGRSVNVNTACSTGLVTIDHACQDLLLGQSDIALAGASSIVVPETQGYVYQSGSIVSKDGTCRPFSSEANGTVFSNGVGVVVLKRLEDAIEDNDTIYAVIKGRGVNNDGGDKLGFTAPSMNGQVSCIRDALHQAQIHPEEVGYVEAHGTATALGDMVEIKALNNVYREFTDKTQFCALGSVKANIGHTDVSAGIAGIIKTALCLYHKKIPPLAHFKSPNPDLSLSDSPFFVNTNLLDWNTSSKRHAAVSSFGVGGTNSHIILSEHEENNDVSSKALPICEELILLSAKTQNATQERVNQLKNYLRENGDASLENIAFTLQKGREDFQWRQFSVGKKAHEIYNDLERKKSIFVNEENRQSLVFLFSGQGAQYPKMALELMESIPLFAHYLRLGSEIAEPILKCDLLSIIRDIDSVKLQETQYAQPALFIIEYALARVLMECGVIPEALIGHSIGEYVAACLSGIFSFTDGVNLVCNRGLLMSKLPRGSMLSLETSKELLEQYLRIADVDIALHNASHHFVLAGTCEEISKLEDYLTKRKHPFHMLNVSHPFHSRHIARIEQPFKDLFANIKLSVPQIPIIANATGDWLRDSEATSPNYWYRHLRETVQFSNSIHRLLQDKNHLFVEIGPGQSLSKLIKEIHNKADTLFTIPDRRQSTSDLFQLLTTFGELWVKGVNLNLQNLVETKSRKHIPLPTYPFQRQRYWISPDKNTTSPKLTTLYKPVWSYEEIINNAPSHLKDFEYVIFIDKLGVGEKILQALLGQGIQPFVIELGKEFKQMDRHHLQINPNEKTDYAKLGLCLKNELINPIIFHCLTCNNESEGYLSTLQIEDNLNYGFYSLLYLTQTLIEELGTLIPIHLSVITTATQRVIGSESICPINATLVGASRVIPREHANISCELIDICLDEDITYLLSDLFSSSTQTQRDKRHNLIAYRNGYRWEPSYLPYQDKRASLHLADNKIYLVTGGLGGIGLSLCMQIAQTTLSPTFIICTRTAPIHESEWACIVNKSKHALHQKIIQLQQLQQLGANIVWQQTDIGDYEDVLNLINFCKTKFGAINGLIHSAGVAGGGLLQLKTKDAAHRVIVSKIHGTYHLAKIMNEFSLDFVALMSSIAAITGEPGQFDYCAANSFLDAFANSRLFNTNHHLSINWNTWRDVGMSVETSRPKDINLFSRGNSITPLEGNQLFLKALASNCSNLIVSNIDVEEYLRQSPNPHANLDEDFHNSPDNQNTSDNFQSPVGNTEKRLAKLWQKYLHTAHIGRDDNFFDLGGHSLKALNLIQEINTTIKTHLSIQHLYQAPTLKELARSIDNNNTETNPEIIIPLKNANSNNLPVFLCHPISGMIYCFKEFADQWDIPVPLYAIQDPSIATGQLQFDSITSMANAYLNAIKKIQPHGPYYLVGYSLGGTLMYEVAHILKTRNESIGILAMIESWCDFSPPQKCRSYIENSNLLKELRNNKELINLSWERMELLLNHKPTKTQQDMMLFKATELSREYQEINDPLNGWAKYNSGKISCHNISSNHDTIIREGCRFIIQQLIKHRDFEWELDPSL